MLDQGRQSIIQYCIVYTEDSGTNVRGEGWGGEEQVGEKYKTAELQQFE